MPYVSTHRKAHESFQQPRTGTLRVWRYLDLARLVHILSGSVLPLVRLTLLDDDFEGSITRGDYERWSRDPANAAAREDPKDRYSERYSSARGTAEVTSRRRCGDCTAVEGAKVPTTGSLPGEDPVFGLRIQDPTAQLPEYPLVADVQADRLRPRARGSGGDVEACQWVISLGFSEISRKSSAGVQSGFGGLNGWRHSGARHRRARWRLEPFHVQAIRRSHVAPAMDRLRRQVLPWSYTCWRD